MNSSISGFISTWTPSLYSTNNRIEVRNVTQGGNDLLAAFPKGAQAMWAGSVMAQVAAVSAGPIYAVAQFFRILFHPLISFPLSVASCAVKENFFESSVACPVTEQTKYYERGDQVAQPVAGTVPIVINGRVRHFVLGYEIIGDIENSIAVERDGRIKRFRFNRLLPGEPFDANCREINYRGERVRVHINWDQEIEFSYIELKVGDSRRYYRLENEVAEPIRASVEVEEPDRRWRRNHYLLGNEIPHAAPGCIELKTSAQMFHFDTGKEIDAPTETSQSFVINGQTRHFASAKLVSRPSLGLSGAFNAIPRLPFHIPTRLSKFSVKALEFVNRNMSNVIRIALIVAGAVLLFFGHAYMAAGALLAVSYEYLDHDLGIIPRRVSLFMEKWLPMVSMVGLFITGSVFSQVMAGSTLLLMIPSVNLFLHQKIGKVVRAVLLLGKDMMIRLFSRRGMPPQTDEFIKTIQAHPQLEECDAPVIERRTLTRQEIDAILAAQDDAYEINPAHLTKEYEPAIQLPQNSNFAELTRLWDTVGARWLEPASYTRLFNRLTDDKRFILFVKERFPEAKRLFFTRNWRLNREENRAQFIALHRAHRAQFQEWVQILAGEKGFRNKEEFIADWVKQQLQFYIGKISGNCPIEGEQHLLNDAVENTAKIVPFLLKPETSQVDIEDALMKLAIEGGNYCSLAMKRASKEVLQGFVEPALIANRPADPNKAFEDEVRFSLQKGRLMGIQSMYNEVASGLRTNEEAQDTADDVHLYEATTRGLKRGVYPLSKEEMANFTLSELLIKETIGLPAQVHLLGEYKRALQGAMNSYGIVPGDLRRNKVVEYLRAWVATNPALTPQDREDLLNGALSNDDEHMMDHDNYVKWNRLMTVILGIQREKAVVAAPAVARSAPQVVLAPGYY